MSCGSWRARVATPRRSGTETEVPPFADARKYNRHSGRSRGGAPRRISVLRWSARRSSSPSHEPPPSQRRECLNLPCATFREALGCLGSAPSVICVLLDRLLTFAQLMKCPNASTTLQALRVLTNAPCATLPGFFRRSLEPLTISSVPPSMQVVMLMLKKFGMKR
eukprot:909110-Pleurochrysis_carterae.AAC.1